MKRFVAILTLLLVAFAAFAQSENSIIIDQNSFRPLQTDALTGVNIDPIGVDSSRRPCARIKMKINRMTREEINGLEVKIHTNNELTKCKTAEYDNGLILELTAKSATRFYLYHPEFGYSNEVTLNLEPNKEYYIEASLNQTYSIIVDSNVTGADVYLDGIFKGRTGDNFRCTISDVMVGEHRLKVSYSNIDHEQKIVVNKNSISFRQNVNTAASEPQFVVFTVEPQSAVVIINNQHYTLTDGAMSIVLDSGSYSYTVTAAGYHPQSGTFSVAGSKVSKNITLTADSATVTLTAPDNAEIWVNGVMKGTSHWSGTLNSGTYIFEARKAGHKSATLSKHITSAEPRQSYTLPAPTPIVGSLIISGTPINADVTLDGKAVGQLPLKLNDILVGEHTVVVSKSGYDAYTQSVTIAEGKTATINATLKKQITSQLKGVTPIEIDSSLTAEQLRAKGEEFYGKKEYNSAVQYYHRAALMGYDVAQNDLGICYELGHGVTKSTTEAVKWYRKAAEQGYARAQNSLGTCYYYGEGVAQDNYEAAKWYRKAAEQGNENAQYNLGYCYENGRGVTQDYTEAVKWYRKAAEQGLAEAQNQLGYCYGNGRGVTQDYTEAVKWHRKAAEQGNENAQCNLGYCYDDGRGVTQDYYEAVKWYRKAAEQGDRQAQNNLGYCYEKGNGVTQDYTEAVKWYRKAAEQGNEIAQNRLGTCYYYGEGVAQDNYEAAKWYRKAAEQGNEIAQNNLGVCYELGHGVTKSITEAVKWYRKAAEQGYARAQDDLGVCYYYGKGVTQDYAEAVKWFRKAAEQGLAEAQNNLGICYELGHGVTKSITEAVKWYRKAAEQGNENAKESLRRLGY